ncbi:MAG: hypothetical protein IK133_05575 [Clostridia bacterium]|nr:hypothetical protein [Clostridia bacterium]
MKKIIIALLLVLSLSLCLAALAEETKTLTAPTDFVFDPMTGEYSFNAVDENVSYYFIRFFEVKDGQISGEYISSSKRIRGGKTGTISGKISLDDVAWGNYAVSLNSFAAAGSDYVSPDPVNIFANYGVGLPLERPEMLAMVSGNEVQFVIDWWTLDNYMYYEYLPLAKITFYADEACTQEVYSDTVDLALLKNTLRKNPPGIEEIWGYTMTGGKHLYIHQGTEVIGGPVGSLSSDIYFCFDLYTYSTTSMGIPAGTYYVTLQALSKDDFVLDSQVTPAITITLTDEEPVAEYEMAATELWHEPGQMDMPGVNPGLQTDRVDFALNQPTVGQLAE